MSKQRCTSRTGPPSPHPPQPRPPVSSTAFRGDREEQNDLVRLIAWQIYSRVPRHASVEVTDVIQAGHLGLLRAPPVDRAEFHCPLPIYARYRIRGEILDMLRRLDSAPRSLRRW